MKKILFTITMLGIAGISYAQKVTLSNPQPVANKELTITYDPAGGKLANQAEIKVNAYTFINDKQSTELLEMKKEGNVFKASFVPADSTVLALFSFSGGGVKDENPKGYYSVFYQNGKPAPFSYFWEAMIYNGMGKAYAGIENNRDKAIQLLETGINTYPAIKDKYFGSYINILNGADKEKAKIVGEIEIKRRNLITKKSETDWNVIAGTYTSLRMAPQADSVTNLWVAQYPKGTMALNKAYTALFREKDLVKKEAALKNIEANFGFNEPNFKDHTNADNVYFMMSEAFAEANDQGKFMTMINKIVNKQTKAQAINSFAWDAAEKKRNVEFATGLSKQSLELLEQAKAEVNPAQKNAAQVIKGIDQNYAMFADSYALLLSHGGKFDEAVKYQDIAVKSNNYSNAEMNGRYVTYLSKAGKADQALEFGEKFVKEGQGSAQMKTDLKAVYKGTESFDAYYGKLEKVAFDKEVAKYRAEMIDRVAPGFSLKNLAGETVSLASLKGKVVIIDYWATWCGPCIASFPGMQMAVDKYKNDPEVAFLFVNTWQNESNRDELVRNFVKNNPYTFNILFDTKNVNDPSKFDVIDQYGVEGIPTKFIVDGNGKIRFKKVGFSGSADGVVRELDALISLAKEAGKNSK